MPLDATSSRLVYRQHRPHIALAALCASQLLQRDIGALGAPRLRHTPCQWMSVDASAHLSYSTVADVLLQVQCVPPNSTRYEPTLRIAAPASLGDPGRD
jgi:hypothetical protein